MAKISDKNQVARLALSILLLLLALNVLQRTGWVPLSNLSILAIYALIFFLPMLIYIKRRHRKGREMLRLHGFKFKYLPFTLVISVVISLVCGALNILGYMLAGSFVDSAAQTTAMVDFSTQNPMVLLLTMVILPAVTEELLMRGVMLSEYEQFGTVRAVLLTSVIFALFHANPVHFLSLLVAGVCYALLTLLFDSVYPALIAHLINNGAVLLIYYNQNFMRYILEDVLFLIVAIVIIFLLLILVLKMLEKVIAERGSRGKLKYLHRRTTRSPYRSICLWLFVAGCIAKAVITYLI
ncbi:MAG: CPBP family intramembrane metalloprotease [Clostridia bacterium]|nr:CPBP family intramembrane metalloprotease [Clostridia bacterium]